MEKKDNSIGKKIDTPKKERKKERKKKKLTTLSSSNSIVQKLDKQQEGRKKKFLRKNVNQLKNIFYDISIVGNAVSRKWKRQKMTQP
jgi:hypothetical protein